MKPPDVGRVTRSATKLSQGKFDSPHDLGGELIGLEMIGRGEIPKPVVSKKRKARNAAGWAQRVALAQNAAEDGPFALRT